MKTKIETPVTLPTTGQCEVLHSLGRTAIVSVTGVTVSDAIPGYFRISPEFEQPVLDGEQKSGFFFPLIAFELTCDFPEEIQVVAQREVSLHGESETEVLHAMSVKLFVSEGKLIGLVVEDTRLCQGEFVTYRFEAKT